ncbi:hypothetical protein llap_951 [Limosa lapponica baueri]|uniref:Uncharacterized protein n=1 Tax=Limosa lapponica baueri TaxID=1758121 RepID=A0A2I0URU6_LIMLA|nr:hypothetical protein llap_951 [Limosa lapponica baueri]
MEGDPAECHNVKYNNTENTVIKREIETVTTMNQPLQIGCSIPDMEETDVRVFLFPICQTSAEERQRISIHIQQLEQGKERH